MADLPENPNSGSAGTEYQTIQALRKMGHNVETVWADDMHRRIHHGNLHYLLELPRTYEREMLKRFRQKSFNVVHVNQPHGYRAARAVRKLNRNTVFVHRSHGLEMRYERDLRPWQEFYASDDRTAARRLASRAISRGFTYSTRQIARFADGHIVSASQCGEYLNEVLGVPNERIAVIPQAAPPGFLSRPAALMTKERLSRVLYVGQYEFCKAPMIVSQVMNRLAETNEQLRFTWVCAAQDHERVTASLNANVKARLTFLDWMPQDRLIEVFDAHGIFLFPSFVEGFGKAFLEAMARGLCVVAASNSAVRDVITDRRDGMLVSTGDFGRMVDRVLELSGSQELANEISRAAVRCAHSYTWDRVARETAAFYNVRLEAKQRELREDCGAGRSAFLESATGRTL